MPELIDWVRSIETGHLFAGASAWDGYMATLAAQACIQSLHTRAPVAVPTPAQPRFYQPQERGEWYARR